MLNDGDDGGDEIDGPDRDEFIDTEETKAAWASSTTRIWERIRRRRFGAAIAAVIVETDLSKIGCRPRRKMCWEHCWEWRRMNKSTIEVLREGRTIGTGWMRTE